MLTRRQYSEEERIKELEIKSKEIKRIETQREKKKKKIEQSLKRSLGQYQTA